MNGRALASLVILGWTFCLGLEPARALPRAAVKVVKREDGIGSLRIRFDGVEKGFAVERVRLELRQVGPLAPASRAQTNRVETVPYDILVPVAVFDQAQPAIEYPLDLVHNPADPYALARLCLWLDRPDSQVTVAIRLRFLGADGKPMGIPTTPEWVEVRLRNTVQVEAIPAKGDEHCKD